MPTAYHCPICSSTSIKIFYTAERIPVHQNLLMPTREAALQCDRGDIVLGLCQACGFISNLTFDPTLLQYSPQYENSQSFSHLFRSYIENLAAYLISQYNLRGKDIVEIGCGKGEFLTLLCEVGNNRGTGFDPSYINGHSAASSQQVVFIHDFYSERYTNYKGDLVCCRHVLEHIHRPAEFIREVRRSIGDQARTVVFFEVPSIAWILRNLTFWDIFYEHCSYFSPGSLTRLFTGCGFHVVRVTEAFGSQYLWLEALPQDGTREVALAGLENPQEVAHAVAHFATHYQDKMVALRRQFDEIEQSGRRCVIWGAGAKGVTILNALDIALACVEFVVDINPRKQSMYVPGTGQQIVPPDSLKTYAPDVIFVMNPNYLDEIRAIVTGMGISAELISL